ncbi:unnamed protein product [Effrenium voratum]|nr:unnamed protein product [Effrenium voratum]
MMSTRTGSKLPALLTPAATYSDGTGYKQARQEPAPSYNKQQKAPQAAAFGKAAFDMGKEALNGKVGDALKQLPGIVKHGASLCAQVAGTSQDRQVPTVGRWYAQGQAV